MKTPLQVRIAVLVPLVFLAGGCKKEEPAPPSLPAQAEAESREIELKPDKAPIVVAAPKVDDRGIPDANFIYQTTRRFFAEQKRSPKNLEELIAKGYMPPLPTPPPGKRYVLNERAAMIQLQDAK